MTDSFQSPLRGTELSADHRTRIGLAEMLRGGVIMDVTTAEEAHVAQEAGAVAVMALERVPSDIRRDGGVARMSPVDKVEEIQKVVSIPVMAKARIGHFIEAEILESLEVDFIDESEVLTPADHAHHAPCSGAGGAFVPIEAAPSSPAPFSATQLA